MVTLVSETFLGKKFSMKLYPLHMPNSPMIYETGYPNLGYKIRDRRQVSPLTLS